MNRLRKTLTFLLMICIIGYSSAWAFDEHENEADNYATVVTHIDKHNQNSDQSPADNQSCDHCCHAFAHILALCTKNEFQFNSANSSEVVMFSHNFISYISSPFSRPPRV